MVHDSADARIERTTDADATRPPLLASDSNPSRTPTTATPVVKMLLILVLGPFVGQTILRFSGLDLTTWGGEAEIASRLWLLSSFTGSMIVTRAILGALLTTKYDAIRDDEQFRRAANDLRDFLMWFFLVSSVLCILPSSWISSVSARPLLCVVQLVLWAVFIIWFVFIGVRALGDIFPRIKTAVGHKVKSNRLARGIPVVLVCFMVIYAVWSLLRRSDTFVSDSYSVIVMILSVFSSVLLLKLWATLATGYVLHCDCKIRDCAGRAAARLNAEVRCIANHMQANAQEANALRQEYEKKRVLANESNALRQEYEQTVRMVDIPTLFVILLVVILDIAYKYIGLGEGRSVSTMADHELLITLGQQADEVTELVIRLISHVDETFTSMVTETYVNGFSSGAVAVELCFANVIYWIITKK